MTDENRMQEFDQAQNNTRWSKMRGCCRQSLEVGPETSSDVYCILFYYFILISILLLFLEPREDNEIYNKLSGRCVCEFQSFHYASILRWLQSDWLSNSPRSCISCRGLTNGRLYTGGHDIFRDWEWNHRCLILGDEQLIHRGSDWEAERMHYSQIARMAVDRRSR